MGKRDHLNLKCQKLAIFSGNTKKTYISAGYRYFFAVFPAERINYTYDNLVLKMKQH